jgi:hypothetical protein
MDQLTSSGCRIALLLCGLFACGLAAGQADESSTAPQPNVVSVTGQVYRDLRPYSHYASGLREFRLHHDLAPKADLRFGLTSNASGKLLPLKHVKIVMDGLLDHWSVDLPIPEEGWFMIPGLDKTEYEGAGVEVSWRGKGAVMWTLDVHTPDLPYRVYRLGDLRLECRVYLAIEWHSSGGKRVMGVERPQAIGRRSTPRSKGAPPMDTYCGGSASVFFNAQPWPKLEAYVISEGGRSLRHELASPLLREAFQLDLRRQDGAPPWSDDALVEFVFVDKSRWQPVQAVDP